MNRKLPLSLTGITMAFPVCGVLAQSNSGQVKRPMNIVYIMSDDHSYQTISAYDKRFINTPNLDWIADHGVRFTNSYVANSLSGPSRACMLTGKHSHANGFTDNTKTFDGGQQTFPKLLQKAGYETAIIGKWHLTSDPTGFNYWDILIGQGDYYNPDFKCNGQIWRSIGSETNATRPNLSVCYCTTRRHIVSGLPTPATWISIRKRFILFPVHSMTIMPGAKLRTNKR